MRVFQKIRHFAAVLALGAAALTAADPSMAADFDTVLAKAKMEGVVVVHGAPGPAYHAALVDAFNKTYPDIKVQFSGAANATAIPSVMSERQAGVFFWDVWVSGPGTMVGTLQLAGFFQPLPPILRPEIMDDSKWERGFASGWMDKGKRLVYDFDGTVQIPAFVNWDAVPKASITSVKDLLKPEFAGKIVMHDPRLDGAGAASLGNAASLTLLRNADEATLTALYKSNPVLSTDHKQIAEWVISGKYPIAIGLDYTALQAAKAGGQGKNVGPLPDSVLKVQQITTGFGGVGLVDGAPHPNAAAVYINWLLSKEGQEAFAKVGRNSRRLDVAPAVPDLMPVAGHEYFVGQAESVVDGHDRLLRLAKQSIPAN